MFVGVASSSESHGMFKGKVNKQTCQARAGRACLRAVPRGRPEGRLAWCGDGDPMSVATMICALAASAFFLAPKARRGRTLRPRYFADHPHNRRLWAVSVHAPERPRPLLDSSRAVNRSLVAMAM